MFTTTSQSLKLVDCYNYCFVDAELIDALLMLNFVDDGCFGY